MSIQSAQAKFLASQFANQPFNMPVFPSRMDAENAKAIIDNFLIASDEYFHALCQEYLGGVSPNSNRDDCKTVFSDAVKDNSLLSDLVDFIEVE